MTNLQWVGVIWAGTLVAIVLFGWRAAKYRDACDAEYERAINDLPPRDRRDAYERQAQQ